MEILLAVATDGILLVDKEPGITSHDVVERVRSCLQKGKGVKVGHAGTLDPFATGLLIILVGQATRLSSYLMAGEKVYEAVLTLGIETDTLDGTGRIVSTQPVPQMSAGYVQHKADAFVGEIDQTPPAYSAIKVGGKRAYALARNGVAVDLRSRKVTISGLKVLTVHLPKITLRIRCSAGTYIRRLAADLGRALGSRGHLTALKRTESGHFHVANALYSKEISHQNKETLRHRTLSLRDALPDAREVWIDEALARKVRNGYQPTPWDLSVGRHTSRPTPEGYRDTRFIKLVNREKLIAVLTVHHEEGGRYDRVSIDKVFAG